MQTTHRFERRSGVFLLSIFLALAVFIVLAGWSYLRVHGNHSRAEVENGLVSVANLKVSQLTQFINERLGDVSVLTDNPAFVDLTRGLAADARGPARGALIAWLNGLRQHYDYDLIQLLDRQGVPILSVPEAPPPAAIIVRRIPEVLASGRVAFQDFYRDERDQREYLGVVAPVADNRSGAEPVAVVSLRIDPARFVFPFLRTWPMQSRSAETLLVRRDGDAVLYLNELRFQPDAALNLRVPLTRVDMPAVQAVLGREGVVEGIDYRGVRVVAAVGRVPNTPWFLVARMDAAEAFQHARQQGWTTALLLLALLLLAAASIGAVWWQQGLMAAKQQYEAALARAADERRTRKIVGRGWDLTVVFDSTRHKRSVSDSVTALLGYSVPEYMALAVGDLVHPDDLRASLDQGLWAAWGAPSGQPKVVRIRHKDGRWIWMDAIVLDLLDDPDVAGLVLNARDVTERHLAVAALQRQRDLYDMLAQTNQAIVRCGDRDELFAAVCRVAVERGHFLIAWIGLIDPLSDILVPACSYGDDGGYLSQVRITIDADSPTGQGPAGQAVRSGQPVICNDFLNDPRTQPWQEMGRRVGVAAAAVFPLAERGRTVGALTLYAKDTGFFTADVLATLEEMAADLSFAITHIALEAERRRAVAALREADERLRLVIAVANVGLFDWDLRSNRVSYSPEWKRQIGYDEDEISDDFNEWRTRVHPDDLEGLVRSELAFLADPQAKYETEFRFRHKDGTYRWIMTQAGLLRDEHGQPVRMLGSHVDITELKRTEEVRQGLEAQLRQSQKLEALGTLAGGIAHDFNNILAAIIGNAELAAQDVGPAHLAAESIEEIRKASRRAKDLVQRILSFSSQQPQPQRVIDLRPVVAETVKLLRATLPAGVDLVVRCEADHACALADATQIQEVLLNLSTNAWHALGGNAGRIEIRLDECSLDPEAAGRLGDLRPGRVVRLAVSDTGVGMDEATRARIFEPFFSTKPVGQGTGLGLSLVSSIVKAHGGAVAVTSEVGKGSTFLVYLPVPDERFATTAVEPAAVSPKGAGQHVLYLDDEEPLVFLVERGLERLGYRVSGFTDPKAALAALHDNPDQFDLVVTDLNMPGISGLDLAREVARLRPNLPVALISGHITDELREQAPQAGVRELIYKPSSVLELCEALQRLLDKPPQRA